MIIVQLRNYGMTESGGYQPYSCHLLGYWPRHRKAYHCMAGCRRGASGVQRSLHCLLDDADFLVRQAVEIVDELVDLFIGLLDLALDG